MAEEIERIYVIPLRKPGFKSSKAAPTAIRRVKKYLTRHMKVEEEKIWIDESLNNALWARGKFKMPSKIRVKAVKFDDGVVEAYLPELEFKKSRRELLKEERAKKEPILRTEEMPEGGEDEVDASGTDDYEMVPTADGDVKLKKKKAPKEKEEKTDEDKETSKKEKPKKEKEETKKTKAKTKSTDKKESKKPAAKKTEKKPSSSSKKETTAKKPVEKKKTTKKPADKKETKK